jgi:ABC-type multidrug transport system fused ATPase/permease subunit
MKKILKVLINFEKKLKLKFLFLFFAILITGIINSISVLSIAPVVDTLLGNKLGDASLFTKTASEFLNIREFDLISSFIFFGTMMFLTGMASVVVQYFILNIKYSAVTELVSKAFTQIFKSKYRFFSQADTGVLSNTFQRESEKIAITMQNVARFMNYVIQILIYLALPLYISSSMTFIFIFAAISICSPILLLNRAVYPMGLKETSSFNVISRTLQESFSASKLILSFARQDVAINKYINSYRTHAKVAVPLQLIVFAINVMIIPFGMIAALLAIYWGYVNGVELAEITMILFAFFRMLPLAGQLSQTRSEIVGFLPAIDQLHALTKEAKNYEQNSNGEEFIDFKKDIVFKNVSFHYPDGKKALKNVNLIFPKNKRIAIVGSSGSGKTTTADIIMGLYQPSSGEITIDNELLSNFNLNSFREKLSYVPQDPFLFNDSIRNNMLWAKPEASENDIWAALKVSFADEFINKLPKKLDTIVGDRGGRLSGGQRQRLSLARAMLKKPSLIVLDESTSSLDSESEKHIQNSIDEISQYVTTISIAHRLSTVKNADIVYVFDDGCLIESGSYLNLVNDNNSHFYKMVNMQNSNLD